MYFVCGWPKSLAVRDGHSHEDVVYMHLDNTFFVIVSTRCFQLWAGGQHRMKRGQLTRDQASIQADGLNKRAFWCSSRRLMAVLTYNNVLHIYGLHQQKEAAVAGCTLPAAAEARACDLYLQYSVPLEQDGAHASDLVADSRSILVGFSEGTCQAYSWQGQMRGRANPFMAWLEKQERLSALAARSTHPADKRQPKARGLAPDRGLPPRQGGRSGGLRPASPHRSSAGGLGLGVRRSASAEVGGSTGAPCIEALDYCAGLRMLALTLADGRCALARASDAGLAAVDQLDLSHWVCGPGSGAQCARIGAAAQMVAVGLASGEVALHRLSGAGPSDGAPARVISLADWGYEPEATGSVADLRWSPDNRALAVGWRRSGLGLWSPSGCRLVCSLRQSARNVRGGATPTPPLYKPAPLLFLESGIATLAWGCEGYRLVAAEASGPGQVLELALAKSLPHSQRIVHHPDPPPGEARALQPELHLLQADDRLLLIAEPPGGGNGSDNAPRALALARQFGEVAAGAATRGADLAVTHLRLPAVYLATNWPLSHAALSADGLDIAVAGRSGLALFSRRSARWRLFGDVSQERELAVQHLLWLPRMVLVCATRDAGKMRTTELLVFPRFHLDASSLLARYPLSQVPLAMDACGQWVVAASAPLEVRLLRVEGAGGEGGADPPAARISLARDLSIISAGPPLRDIALVECVPPTFHVRGGGADAADEAREPRHAVLLRAGGVLSLLDLEQGSETSLADDIECFWLSGRAAPPAPGLNGRAGSVLLPPAASLSGPEARAWQPATPQRDIADEPQPASKQADGLQPPVSPFETSPLLDRVGCGPHSAGPAAQGPSAASSMAGDALAAPQDSGLRPVKTPGGSPEAGSVASTSGRGSEAVEIPWWTYGARGMQLWFPSSLGEPVSPAAAARSWPATDPELEFDREVYPIGISLAEVSIVGVTQRVLRSPALAAGAGNAPGERRGSAGTVPGGYAHARLPLFQPIPESQPVLPCLLRRLLQQERYTEAAVLARRHSRAPHFARSLEWLLFTSLELDADTLPAQRRAPPAPSGRRSEAAGPLLVAAANLIRPFPQFADIVVSVARKTDAAMWPALFAAVGAPSALLDGLVDAGALASAACTLLIVDCIQGAPAAHAAALRLLRLALVKEQYELASELLRFVVPPGDNDALWSGGTEAPSGPGGPGAGAPLLHKPAMQLQRQGTAAWLGSWFRSAESKGSVTSQANGYTAESAGPRSLSSPSDSGSNASEAEGAGAAAWRLIGAHAWHLLEGGRLRALATLGSALGSVGGSLRALLTSARREAWPPPSAATVLAAISTAERELPVLSDAGAAMAAEQLLPACHAAGATEWALALALALDNTLVLRDLAEAHSELWAEVRGAAAADPGLRHYWDGLAVADIAPLTGPAGNHDTAGSVHSAPSLGPDAGGMGLDAPREWGSGLPPGLPPGYASFTAATQDLEAAHLRPDGTPRFAFTSPRGPGQ